MWKGSPLLRRARLFWRDCGEHRVGGLVGAGWIERGSSAASTTLVARQGEGISKSGLDRVF
jgi:hypothetical protein